MGKYVSIRKIAHILASRSWWVTLVCKYNAITLYVRGALGQVRGREVGGQSYSSAGNDPVCTRTDDHENKTEC